MNLINLDANASFPPLQSAKQAFIHGVDLDGNASSPHALGRLQRQILDRARQAVAHALGGKEKEVFFTSGASEGNRWLVDSMIKASSLRNQALKVLASPLEHPSLAKPLLLAHQMGQIELRWLRVNPAGQLQSEPNEFEWAGAVFVTAAHNETGIIPDWNRIINLAPPKTMLIADAAQALGRISPLPGRVDALVVSAHKMGGIAGCGAVLLRGNARSLPAPWVGGGQEGGLRPGTESVPLISAFGAAALEIKATRLAHQNLKGLRDEIETKLTQALPWARVIGQAHPRLPNTIAIMLSPIPGEALRIALDQAGLCVGFGSACSALAPEPSPSLLALGLTAEQARATVRISLHPELNITDAREAMERLIQTVREITHHNL